MIDKHMSVNAITFLEERSKRDRSALRKDEIEQYVQLGGRVFQVGNFYYTEEFSSANVFYGLHHATVKRLVREGKCKVERTD